MRAALVIAGKDLRERFRDRSFFIIGILAPFALAFIFSLLLGQVTDGAFRPSLGVADLDDSPTSGGLVDLLAELDRQQVISLEQNLTAEEVEGAVEQGDLAAGYVIPPGFGEAVMSGNQARLQVIGNIDAPTSRAVAEGIAKGYLQRLRTAQLAVTAAATLGGIPPDPELGERAATAPPPVELGRIEAATRELDGPTYYTAGMAVFFVFFTVAIGVTNLLDEGRQGTLARLLAAPIPRTAIVAGKAVTSFVLGITSMAVLAVASTLLIGADWGDPLGAALLIAAVVVAAMGIMALVAGLANTPESAGNIQSIIAVTLGALGGSFFPVGLVGEGFLSRISLLTPHHWFLRGLADLSGGETAAEILPNLGAIVAFGVVTGAVGWLRLRRKVAR